MADVVRQDCFAQIDIKDAICIGDGDGGAEGPCPQFEDCKYASELSDGVPWNGLNKSQQIEIEQKIENKKDSPRRRAAISTTVAPVDDGSIEDDIDKELGDIGVNTKASSVIPETIPEPVEKPKRKGRGRPAKVKKDVEPEHVMQTALEIPSVIEPVVPESVLEPVVEPKTEASKESVVKENFNCGAASIPIIAVFERVADELVVLLKNLNSKYESVTEAPIEDVSIKRRKRKKNTITVKAVKSTGKKRGRKPGKKKGK